MSEAGGDPEEIEVPVPEVEDAEGAGAPGAFDAHPSTAALAEAAVESNDKKTEKKVRERKDPEPCEKPDPAKYKQRSDAVNAKMAQVQAEIEKLTAQIDTKSLAREKLRATVTAAYDQLAEFKKQRQANSRFIEEARQQYAEVCKKRAEQRESLAILKQGLHFSTHAQVEDAIKKIELRINTTPLAPALRAKYLNDIMLLQSQRVATMRYEEQVKLVRLGLVDPTPLTAARDAKLKENRQLYDQEQKIFDDMQGVKKQAEDMNKTISAQVETRKKKYDEKRVFQKELSDIDRELNNHQRKYDRWVQFSEYQKRQAKREKWAAEKAEREAKQAERAAARESRAAGGAEVEDEQTPQNWSGDGTYQSKKGLAVSDLKPKAFGAAAPKRNPYEMELTIISDLKRYLEFYKPKDVTRTSEATSSDAPVAQPRREFNEKKVVPLTKKDEITDEWGSVLGTSKPSKAPRGDAPKPKKFKDTPVNHIPEALAKFKKINVEPPLVSSKIESVLKILEEKKVYYENANKEDKKPDETTPANPTDTQTDTADRANADESAATETKKPDDELEEGEIVEPEDAEEGEIVDKAEASAGTKAEEQPSESVDTGEPEPEEEPAEEEEEAPVAVDEQTMAAVDGALAIAESEAIQNLATAVAVDTIQDVTQAVDALPKPEPPEEEDDLTPSQAAAIVSETQAAERKEQDGNQKGPEGDEETSAEDAAFAAMFGDIDLITGEAQAALGDYRPPVEKKPEHKDGKPTEALPAEPIATAIEELTTITAETQKEVVGAVNKAIENSATATETEAAEDEEGEGEAEGDEGDGEEEEESAQAEPTIAAAPQTASNSTPAPTSDAGNADADEEVEGEGDEGDEGEDEPEAEATQEQQ